MTTPSNDDYMQTPPPPYEPELRPPVYYKALHNLKAALGLHQIDYLSLKILRSVKSLSHRAVDEEIRRQLRSLAGLGWNDNCIVDYWTMEIVRAPIVRLIEDGRAREINIIARLRIRVSRCGDDHDHDHEVCSICLDILDGEDGVEKIATLDCRHEFHVACITKWLLTRKNFCPLCRVRALEIDDDDDEDVDDGFL